MLYHAPMLMVISPLVGALLLRITSRFLPSRIYRDLITFISLLTPMVLLLLLSPILSQGPIVYEMGGWPRPFGISLVLDGLSSFMALLVGIVTICCFIYSLETEEMIPKIDDYYFLFLFMTTGLYGVFLTGDIVNRYVFFEITILTTYVLLTYTGTRSSLKASFYYLIVGSVASFMFLMGIGLLYFYTGYLDMGALASTVPALPVSQRNIIFSFFLIAVGVKVAVVPFHTWLPDAHVSAPTPMTAVLAGVTVKTGAYILLKLFYLGFDTFLIRYLVVVLGVITALTAALISLKYYDMKKILAWLTISHMGVITAVLALWTPAGVSAGLLYLLNHTLYKTLLFLSVGGMIILHGTSDIRKLPVMKSNVLLSSACLIGLLSMAGLPPFNGFYGRFYLLESTKNITGLFVVILIVHFITALSVFRILRLSAKESDDDDHTLKESIMKPMVVLSGLCIFGGLTTSILMNNVIDPAVYSQMGEVYRTNIPWQITYSTIASYAGILIIVAVVLAYFLSTYTHKIPLKWTDGLLSEVTLPDSIRYMVIIIAVLLLLNFI